MREISYVVRPGDTLSGLAKQHLGDLQAWPRLVEHNNDPRVVALTGTRITDPDLILVGQKLMIPVGAPAGPGRVVPPSARPRTTPRTGMKPAIPQCTLPTLEYKLEDLGEIRYFGFGWQASIKLGGAIQLQEKCTTNLVTLNNKGFELSAKSKADKVLGSLIVNSSKVGYDATTNEVTFECGVTIHSKFPYAPSTALSSGISSSGRPSVKATIQARNLEGEFKGFMYVVAELKVEIEIEIDPPTARPRGPVPVPVPATRRAPLLTKEQVQLVGGALILTAVVVAAVIFLPVTAVAYAAVAGMLVVSVGVNGKIRGGSPVGI